MLIDTTDVQMSLATVGSDSVLIRCNFLTGSQSRGCHVKLEFYSNITISFNIARVNGSDYAEDYYYDTCINRYFVNILVVDWERNGSIGSLPVPVDIERPPGLGASYLVPIAT